MASGQQNSICPDRHYLDGFGMTDPSLNSLNYNYVENFRSEGASETSPHSIQNRKSFLSSSICSTFRQTPQIQIKPLQACLNRRQPLYMHGKQAQDSLQRAWNKIKQMEARMVKWKRLIMQVADRVGLKSDQYLDDRNDRCQDDFKNVTVAKRTQKKESDQKKQVVLRKFNEQAKKGMTITKFAEEYKVPERTLRRWISNK